MDSKIRVIHPSVELSNGKRAQIAQTGVQQRTNSAGGREDIANVILFAEDGQYYTMYSPRDNQGDYDRGRFPTRAKAIASVPHTFIPTTR